MNSTSPESGMRVRNRKTKSQWTIVSIDRHINSQDISYIRMMNQWGRHRSITLYQWTTEWEVLAHSTDA